MLGWLDCLLGWRKPARKLDKKQKEPKINLLATLRTKVEITEIFQRRPSTMVRIQVQHGDQLFATFGFSKASHPDKWSELKGMEIARDHALIYLIQTYHLRPELPDSG